jgi:hypothetical protein
MAGFSRIPILADRIAAYRQAVRSGAMLPDERLSYGLSMFVLGVSMLLFTYAASWQPPAVMQRMRDWHMPFRTIFFGGLLLLGCLRGIACPRPS